MHKNLKMIIEIFSTIYLSLAVLFPFVSFYQYHESWFHKIRKYFYLTSNCLFLAKIIPSGTTLNSLNFYTPAKTISYTLIGSVKGILIREDVIFAAPIVFLNNIYPLIAHYIKTLYHIQIHFIKDYKYILMRIQLIIYTLIILEVK